MLKNRHYIVSIILVGLVAAAIGLLTNVVSVGIVMPLWLAWSLLIVAIGWGIGLTVWQFLLQRDNETVTASQQDRQRLLAKVQSFWIKGILEQSLYNVVHLELGLHEQPDAIANPWHLVLQQQNQPAHPVHSSTHIIQVYDDALGELLILGEPGSGKTTLLLELARNLLRRAVADESHPMPIVFNLSSWAVKRKPLTDWLVEEMNIKYQVPRKLGRAWVESNQVLPLLDGLDEVNSDHREACVDSINAYRLQHGLVPMVVCSRSVDYLELKKRMLLRTAVVVEPLTAQQIDDYLSTAGGQLEAVLMAFRKDNKLQELVSTPLMLSVLTLAYRGKSVEDILEKDSLETRRKQAFATYIKRMMERRGTNTRYSSQQTKHWLTWLAKQVEQHNQTVFYIERIQPDWITDTRLRFIYRFVVSLIFGLILGLGYGLMVGLMAGLIIGLASGLGFWFWKEIMTMKDIIWSTQRAWRDSSSILGYLRFILLAAYMLLFGAITQGIAFIQHFILRCFLWRGRYIPWNYPRFLDYAADRILLRKVGGGYIFIHRLLLEYFASLEVTP